MIYIRGMLVPKERILEAAAHLFHRNGYNATGVNAIIDEARVAKASFYDHYETKEDLAVAYLNHRHDLWFEGLIGEVDKKQTVTSKVVAAFKYLKKMNEKEDYRGCAFLNMMSEEPHASKKIWEIIHGHKLQLQAFFEEMLDNKEKAFLIYMLFESCITESQLFKSQRYLTKTIKIITTSIL